MATLEDKILGEKLQYYCSSSSEDEGDNDSDNSCKEDEGCAPLEMPQKETSMEFSEWDGTSCNTGPKGVIRVCYLDFT